MENSIVLCTKNMGYKNRIMIMENSIIFNGPSIIMIITKKYYRWINTKSYTIVIIVIIMMSNDE